MFPVAIWLGLCAWIAWKGGVSQGALPAPYRLWGATGAMAFAMVIGMMNRQVGNVSAVALALGAVLYYQSHPSAVDVTDSINIGMPGQQIPQPGTPSGGSYSPSGLEPLAPKNTAIPPSLIPGQVPGIVARPGSH